MASRIAILGLSLTPSVLLVWAYVASSGARLSEGLPCGVISALAFVITLAVLARRWRRDVGEGPRAVAPSA
ncbi:MAG TPA: hypothetical protein RMH99_08510 [Sandaracinaceae bacterium LLY-WYZ-13_1]|nr:hypothetical protein [Sandaracinaceae bacterium LLY-WYZ-13_1]